MPGSFHIEKKNAKHCCYVPFLKRESKPISLILKMINHSGVEVWKENRINSFK